MPPATFSLPDLTAPDADVVVRAPAGGPGNWAGAATAVEHDGTTYLTYRVRRPLTEGRGVVTVVASSADGVTFTPVCEVARDGYGAESFERPALVRRPDGGWRLYLSCATPGSKHWWIESLDADTVEDLPQGVRTVVLPGSDSVAVKDPVVLVDDQGGWHAWICEHPLSEPGHEDRMSTAYHRSPDGLEWERVGTVLSPRAGEWDARGARVAAVVSSDPVVVLYDGRPTAEDNWHEVTGVARAVDPALGLASPLAALDVDPIRSTWSDGALRYATAVAQDDGSVRYYVERAAADGSHDLVTVLQPTAG